MSYIESLEKKIIHIGVDRANANANVQNFSFIPKD